MSIFELNTNEIELVDGAATPEQNGHADGHAAGKAIEAAVEAVGDAISDAWNWVKSKF